MSRFFVVFFSFLLSVDLMRKIVNLFSLEVNEYVLTDYTFLIGKVEEALLFSVLKVPWGFRRWIHICDGLTAAHRAGMRSLLMDLLVQSKSKVSHANLENICFKKFMLATPLK